MFERIRNAMRSEHAKPEPVVPEECRPSNAAHFEDEAKALAKALDEEAKKLGVSIDIPQYSSQEGNPDIEWSMAVVRAAEELINNHAPQPKFYNPDAELPEQSAEEQERAVKWARIVEAWKRARAAGESFIAQDSEGRSRL